MASSLDFRLLFESAPGMDLVLDTDLRIVAVSDAYLAATMTERDGIIGSDLSEIFPDDSQDQSGSVTDDLRSSLEIVLSTGKPDTMPLRKYDFGRQETAAGSAERHWRMTNTPVFDEDRLAYIIHHMEDATDFVRLERQSLEQESTHEQLRTSVEQMSAAERAKDEFIAVISHELRTPMTSILGWTRMLALGGLDEETHRDALEALERSTRAQARLIEDLLDESRISAGKLRLELRSSDLGGLVADAVRMARPAAEAKKISLSFTPPQETYQMFGDPARLQQVIGNLLGNAMKFTQEGGSVDVRLVRHDSFALVEVSDSGRGIDPSLLPFIFDRFRQGSASGERQDGLGLGLAITRHLVEMHGGSVYATSEGAGKGSTFTIRLPLHESDTPAEFVGRDSFARTASLPKLDGVRVLMVEDEIDNRDVLSMALERCGAEVECSTTAEAAQRLVESWHPDVIVCDISLPDCDGCTFLQNIRSSGFAVPALALTVLGRPKEQARIVAAGFDVFRQKPIDPIDLAHDVVRLALRARGARV